MSNLPANADMTGASVTQGQFRARLNDVLNYRRGGLGSTGAPTSMRAALGLGALATLNEVGAAELGAGAVTEAKLAAAAVSTVKLAAASVTTAKLADAAVTTAKLANASVTAEKLAPNVVPAGVPTGTVVAFAAAAAPSGWLVCNGAAISRTTYAALFAVVGTAYGGGDGTTTFNLPDLRGEFVRGLDGGRGVDPGRVLGSPQGSQNLAHTHAASTDVAGSHSHTVPAGLVSGPGSLGFSLNGERVESASSSAAGAHSHTVTVQSSGGGEARPRNVALLYIIKT